MAAATLIVTSSPAPGTCCGDQLLATFHEPLALIAQLMATGTVRSSSVSSCSCNAGLIRRPQRGWLRERGEDIRDSSARSERTDIGAISLESGTGSQLRLRNGKHHCLPAGQPLAE